MTVAILDVCPTLTSDVGLSAGAARTFVPRFALEPRQLRRQSLICRWYLDRESGLVCIWDFEPLRPAVELTSAKQEIPVRRRAALGSTRALSAYALGGRPVVSKKNHHLTEEQ